ncbi:MAG: type IV pilus twitching motility protein PilT [candidate division WOR-3 bacterium]
MEEINKLLKDTVSLKASDLHLSAGSPIMMRIYGQMKKINEHPVDCAEVKNLIYQVLNKEQISVLENNYEIDFSLSLPDIGRFRVNVFYQRFGLGAVFRVIPNQIPSMEEIGLPKVIKDLIDLENGLILVTGPTGSGKSTTLAAMIDYINTSKYGHIITIEDPIEFIHQSKNCIVNQREVGTNTRSFANALRSALREDPDYILVGELRDLETIALALTAAETGHLVFGTLHTQDAPKTITRIIDIFPSGQKDQIRLQLSESLQAVIAQRLYPKKDKTGRVAAFEILVANQAVRNLIREEKIFQIESVIQISRQQGMQNLEQAKRRLVAEGKLDPAFLEERFSLY